MCSQFGILDGHGGLSEPWTAAAEAADRWLKKTYLSNLQLSDDGNDIIISGKAKKEDDQADLKDDIFSIF